MLKETSQVCSYLGDDISVGREVAETWVRRVDGGQGVDPERWERERWLLLLVEGRWMESRGR